MAARESARARERKEFFSLLVLACSLAMGDDSLVLSLLLLAPSIEAASSHPPGSSLCIDVPALVEAALLCEGMREEKASAFSSSGDDDRWFERKKKREEKARSFPCGCSSGLSLSPSPLFTTPQAHPFLRLRPKSIHPEEGGARHVSGKREREPPLRGRSLWSEREKKEKPSCRQPL